MLHDRAALVRAIDARLADLDALVLPFNTALSELQRDHPGAWGLLVIDLDNLKKVNDTFGHPCGDRLLASAAETIASVVPGGRAFRIGGDELAVLTPLEAGKASLVEVAERILEALKTPWITSAMPTREANCGPGKSPTETWQYRSVEGGGNSAQKGPRQQQSPDARSVPMSSYRQSWPANSVTTAACIDTCRAGRGDVEELRSSPSSLPAELPPKDMIRDKRDQAGNNGRQQQRYNR
jgi:GGDEF domain-containing protein